MDTEGTCNSLQYWLTSGTGQTIPFECFVSPEERALAQASYPMGLSDSTDVALGDLWAGADVLTNICGEARADIGSLVGTAFVARDMMRVVDALDEDGLLRFWGRALSRTVMICRMTLSPVG